MKKAPILPTEPLRLKVLQDYEVLDTLPERQFDDITRLASDICQTPIALVSLIDKDRQWFKSKQGLAAAETPRDISYCGHAIHDSQVFIVNDAFADERFADNPLATGAPHVRFYAGAPLITPSGYAVGTLCVIDNKPRELSQHQIEMLKTLSRIVVDQLEIRLANKKLAEHIRIEEQNRQVIDQQRAVLHQSSKMASLGEMAGGISHEINNPLAIIEGNAAKINRLLDENNFNVDDLKKAALKIEKTTERIAKIITGLKSFARDGDNDPFSFATVKSIVDDTLSFCEARLANNLIQVKINAFDPNLKMECRGVQISQVLLNLVSNSSDAISGTEKPWIEIQVTDLGERVQIAVIDSGKGIPIEIANKILQPFFTTKPVGKGTGLGLSITKGIIESHHGRFFLDQECINTKFVIELPKRIAKSNKPAA